MHGCNEGADFLAVVGEGLRSRNVQILEVRKHLQLQCRRRLDYPTRRACVNSGPKSCKPDRRIESSLPILVYGTNAS